MGAQLTLQDCRHVPMEKPMPSVAAGKAAGMEAAAVPFLPKQCHIYASADEVINSLLDLRPEKWGLLAFQDWIKGTLVLEKLGILGMKFPSLEKLIEKIHGDQKIAGKFLELPLKAQL
ncbi:hypothetical protein SAY87_022876 [Trapa incisa]|uniref:Uncharacterized protein n=1 Tax=Trapa incisa TaxID=236973 RepID=A0AAN7KAX7_9MYRT|nr:hypothetical protein SAY87_022876 [Trapa incisa]